MANTKINTDELVESFQKLGDSYRALRVFIKNNKSGLPKTLTKRLAELADELSDKQQELIDFAFDEVIRKKKP